jgi:murein DD-endopeptidase MepM/ murein hydrolase activator NlpD
MNRVGWLLLLTFVALAAGFVMLLGGEAQAPASRSTVEAQLPRLPRSRLAIPVAGVENNELADSWGDARGGGSRRHNAIDIMAPRGTPVVAAADGVVEKLFDSRNGGRTIYVRSDDERIIYYYAHLDRYRPGLAEGLPVRTGDVIGTVGSTGSASDEGPHLHFEIKRMAAGERWHEGREVNPYPLLAGQPASR